MRAIDLALAHISRGTSYSWDLSTLISSGVPLSYQMRQKILAGTTTSHDADDIRKLMSLQLKERRSLPRSR